MNRKYVVLHIKTNHRSKKLVVVLFTYPSYLPPHPILFTSPFHPIYLPILLTYPSYPIHELFFRMKTVYGFLTYIHVHAHMHTYTYTHTYAHLRILYFCAWINIILSMTIFDRIRSVYTPFIHYIVIYLFINVFIYVWHIHTFLFLSRK